MPLSAKSNLGHLFHTKPHYFYRPTKCSTNPRWTSMKSWSKSQTLVFTKPTTCLQNCQRVNGFILEMTTATTTTTIHPSSICAIIIPRCHIIFSLPWQKKYSFPSLNFRSSLFVMGLSIFSDSCLLFAFTACQVSINYNPEPNSELGSDLYKRIITSCKETLSWLGRRA